jgi:hypothetical protein
MGVIFVLYATRYRRHKGHHSDTTAGHEKTVLSFQTLYSEVIQLII